MRYMRSTMILKNIAPQKVFKTQRRQSRQTAVSQVAAFRFTASEDSKTPFKVFYNFRISLWCLMLEIFWSFWCIFLKYILLALQTIDCPCMHKQTKHPLISYCRAFTLKRSAKRQKNKATEQHQQTSIVIMCQGQRWNRGQKAPFGHMWPVLEFMNSAWWGPRQGYVTAGQQGACRLLRYWGGAMGWEVRETKGLGEERRREDMPARPEHWFTMMVLSLCFSSVLILLTNNLTIMPNRQKRRGSLANHRQVDIL